MTQVKGTVCSPALLQPRSWSQLAPEELELTAR